MGSLSIAITILRRTDSVTTLAAVLGIIQTNLLCSPESGKYLWRVKMIVYAPKAGGILIRFIVASTAEVKMGKLVTRL